MRRTLFAIGASALLGFSPPTLAATKTLRLGEAMNLVGGSGVIQVSACHPARRELTVILGLKISGFFQDSVVTFVERLGEGDKFVPESESQVWVLRKVGEDCSGTFERP